MKLTSIALFAALFVATVCPAAEPANAGPTTPAPGQPAAIPPLKPGTPQWEYLQIGALNDGAQMSKEHLNNFGAKGWELVAVCAIPGRIGQTAFVSWNYTFKRPKQD